jgi:chorismate mutase
MRIGLVLVAIVVAGCASDQPSASTATSDTVAFDHLLGLIRQRLELMHDVARWKWNARAPIADLQRERRSIEAFVAAAREQGVDEQFAAAFLEAQMAAARQIQEADFARWEAEGAGAFADVPDLAGELRPQIDRLNADLIAALAAATVADRADEAFADADIDAETQATALDPLVRPAAGVAP